MNSIENVSGCIWCKKPFEPKCSTQKACSTECRQRYRTKDRANLRLKSRKPCPFCLKKILPSSTSCTSCNNTIDKTISLKEYYASKKSRFSIRRFAYNWNPHLRGLPCQKCGYKLHTHHCHIKPISSFDENSTLEDVNKESNLIMLCPNHHWEFDHGFLKLEDIPAR